MTYLCLCTAIAVLGYIVLYRKKVDVYLNQFSGNSKLSKYILFALIFSISALFFIPFLSYQYPRLALGFLILMMIIYILAVYRYEHQKNEKINRIWNCLSDKKAYFSGLLVAMVVCGVFSAILSSYSFPVAEGWYSLYAKLINQGELPYKDFELLFTPFYAYIIAWITRVFGYELIVLRITGVLLFMFIAALHYMIYEKIFRSPMIASVSAIAAAVYQQSEVVQVFYDYIRFFDFFVYLGTLLLLVFLSRFVTLCKPVSASRNKRPIWMWLGASGICMALSTLIRQNSGAIAAFYIIVLMIGLIVVFKERKILVRGLAAYICGVILPIAVCAVFMQQSGMLSLFLHDTTSSALASKGGIVTVLFAWIPKVMVKGAQNSLLIFGIVVFLIANYCLLKKNGTSIGGEFRKKVSGSLILIFSLLICILAAFFSSIAHSFGAVNVHTEMPFVVFFVGLELFIFELVRIVNHSNIEKEHLEIHLLLFATLGMAFAINYGSGTSASLSQGQTAMNVGLIIAVTFYLLRHQYSRPLWMVMLISVSTMTISNMVYKYEEPYGWWGLTEAPIYEDTYTLDVPNVHGIRVSESTYTGITGIYEDIKDNSSPEDSIFVFPHAPIFYVLTDRYADTYTYVQWFDVSSDSAVNADMDILAKSMPKVIVHFHVPDIVIEAHEEMFRTDDERCGLYNMDQMLTKLEKNGQYKLVNSYTIQQYGVDVYSRIGEDGQE